MPVLDIVETAKTAVNLASRSAATRASTMGRSHTK
jgi:hypothetical protein